MVLFTEGLFLLKSYPHLLQLATESGKTQGKRLLTEVRKYVKKSVFDALAKFLFSLQVKP